MRSPGGGPIATGTCERPRRGGKAIVRISGPDALAAASGVPLPAIAGIESGRIALRGERAEKLARALKVHPAVLMWPQWGEEERRAG